MKAAPIFTSLLFLVLRCSEAVSQSSVSGFEYHETGPVNLAFEAITLNGNKNILYKSKDADNNFFFSKLYINRVQESSEALPHVRTKTITDLVSNDDGTYNILIVSADDHTIYNIRTKPDDTFEVLDTVTVKNVKRGWSDVNSPKYFQGNFLYFSDGKLLLRANKNSAFVCDAIDGGFEKYTTDNKNFAYFTRYRTLLLNGEIFHDNPFDYYADYFFKEGRLFVKTPYLHELKITDSGLESVKITDPIVGVTTHESQEREFYTTKNLGDSTIRYIYKPDGPGLVLKDSSNFFRNYEIKGDDFSIAVETGLTATYGYSGYYYNKIHVTPKEFTPFTFNWIATTGFITGELISRLDNKLLVKFTQINSENTYVLVDLSDGKKLKILKFDSFLSADIARVKSDSTLNTFNLQTLEESSRPLPVIKHTPARYPSWLGLEEYYNSLWVYGLADAQLKNLSEYKKYDLGYTIDLTSGNREPSGTIGFKVFFGHENITREVSYLEDKTIIFKDSETGEKATVVLPYSIDKTFNERFCVYFPNNHLAIIATVNGIYCYNFKTGKTELLVNAHRIRVDRFTHDILAFQNNGYQKNNFDYYFFSKNTTEAQKKTKVFDSNPYLADFNHSLVSVLAGNKDLLFGTDDQGNFTPVKPFWEGNISSFAKNGDEIIVITADDYNLKHTLYSSKYDPLEVPFEAGRVISQGSTVVTGQEILFPLFYNDYFRVARFSFSTRRFYLLNENVVSMNFGTLFNASCDFSILRNHTMYYSFYNASKNIQFRSEKLYGDFQPTLIPHGPYKGGYVFGSLKNGNPQVYKLDNATLDLNWLLIGEDETVLSQEKEPDVRVYPNPAPDKISVNSPVEINQVEILDLTGRVLIISRKENVIDISRIPGGHYMMRVKTRDKLLTKRFIKL